MIRVIGPNLENPIPRERDLLDLQDEGVALNDATDTPRTLPANDDLALTADAPAGSARIYNPAMPGIPAGTNRRRA